MWYKNISGRFFGSVTKHASDRRTDRRTDGQNYDFQDRASIDASRGKNSERTQNNTTDVQTTDDLRNGIGSTTIWAHSGHRRRLTALPAQDYAPFASEIKPAVYMITGSVTARRNARIASAVLATATPSVGPFVCLSVRLSHASIVSKRLQFALSDKKMCLVF